jgi:hypothetical protein
MRIKRIRKSLQYRRDIYSKLRRATLIGKRMTDKK